MRLLLLLLLPALVSARELKTPVKPKASASRTVTAKGLARFPFPKDWTLDERWKEDVPSAVAEKKTPDGVSTLAVRFYPAGNHDHATVQSLLDQASLPNREFDKKVEPLVRTEVAGQEAKLLGISRLDQMSAALGGVIRRRIRQELVAAEYAGGFFTLSLTAPEAAWDEPKAHFDRLLKEFVLLAKPRPKEPLAPAATGQAPARAP